ncbi:hypothetical protein Trydic_g7339 [Trypoxylus dichotomus]
MWGRVVLALVLVFAVGAITGKGSFRDGLTSYLENGKFSPEFRKLLRSAGLKHTLRFNVTRLDDDTICTLCDELVELVLNLINVNAITIEETQSLLVEICVTAFFEDEDICYGAISSNIGIAWYIAQARPEKQSSEVCAIIGQSYGCIGTLNDWSINIPETPTKSLKNEVSENFKILHLSDIHYDSLYQSGSLGACDLPVCCTMGTQATNEGDAAGYWGDYRDCDTPEIAIDDALNRIAEQHSDVDFIYYTGDIISHRVWNTSHDSNSRDISLIFGKMLSVLGDTKVYPSLGNHEAHPLNAYAPLEIEDENLSTAWLYELITSLWSNWLDTSAIDTLNAGGFYQILIKPGLRLISLNNNVAYTFNWWLLYDDVDPYGQLQWLSDTLYEAEQNGEKIHIIGHQPSSRPSIHKIWSREYRRIIQRFSATIAGIFNGHTHTDELILYHSSEDPNLPINVAWNGGSLTTFSDKNPNYKVYDIDGGTYEVLDYDVWVYNITDANLKPNEAPDWYKLYSFKEAYGLSGATPADVHQLVVNMADDRATMEQYFEYSVKKADSALVSGCDTDCLKSMLCASVKSEYSDETQCLLLPNEW